MPNRNYNVLFLCNGNSARSAFGEVLVSHWGNGRFFGYSAGTEPHDEVHPFTLQLLQEHGVTADRLHTKSWHSFIKPEAPEMDFIFTVCDDAAAETCPVWPGEPITAHWSVPDPVHAHGSDVERMLAFREAFGLLNRRIKLFLSLPLHSLDRLAIHHEVHKIGQMYHHDEF